MTPKRRPSYPSPRIGDKRSPPLTFEQEGSESDPSCSKVGERSASGQAVGMRFIVYGAGAVGGAIGGRLAQQRYDVTLIARGPHHDAIFHDGLRVEDPDTAVTLPIPVVDHPSKIA